MVKNAASTGVILCSPLSNQAPNWRKRKSVVLSSGRRNEPEAPLRREKSEGYRTISIWNISTADMEVFICFVIVAHLAEPHRVT